MRPAARQTDPPRSRRPDEHSRRRPPIEHIAQLADERPRREVIEPARLAADEGGIAGCDPA